MNANMNASAGANAPERDDLAPTQLAGPNNQTGTTHQPELTNRVDTLTRTPNPGLVHALRPSPGSTVSILDDHRRINTGFPSPAGCECGSAAPNPGDLKLAFVYDYMGRRVQKKVWTWDPQAGQAGAWVLTGHRKFAWNGWLLLIELDGVNDDAVLRKRTWGLDLSGLTGGGSSAGLASSRSMLEGAGGIGGLLAVHDATIGQNGADYVYFYDANGNVGQLVDLSHAPSDPAGAIVARYEYDPYGNVTSQSGAYASDNPFRFSTKYWDDETGLGYWGYRYYDPKLGRWVSRDPVDEDGGANLHGYLLNAPTLSVDPFGLMSISDCNSCVSQLLANDAVLQLLVKCAKHVPPGRRFPCFGKASCFFCLGGAQGWYNPCRISGDIGLCANNLANCDEVREVLLHELVHAITMCRQFFPRTWNGLYFGDNRCQRCLVHEMLAYAYTGACPDFNSCLDKAEASCRMSLSCIGRIDNDKKAVRNRWEPRWNGGFPPYIDDYCDAVAKSGGQSGGK